MTPDHGDLLVTFYIHINKVNVQLTCKRRLSSIVTVHIYVRSNLPETHTMTSGPHRRVTQTQTNGLQGAHTFKLTYIQTLD